MAKDPAFLFYSKDFYESTRMMLPKERACLIDLMIYQHQNGAVPNDLERVMLYCTGVSEATLKATLQAKFKLASDGWVNRRLESVVAERETFKGKQAINGKIGQFWKKAKSALKVKDYKDFREFVYSTHTNETLNKELEKFKGSHEGLLKAMLKQSKYAIANEDVINKKGGKSEKFTPPTEKEVIDYFQEKGYTIESAKKAFAYYDSAKWHDKNGTPVLNWHQKVIANWFKDDNKEVSNGRPAHLKGLLEDDAEVIKWKLSMDAKQRR